MATTSPAAQRKPSTRHVRADIVIAAGLIVITALGRLLWRASDAGWFGTIGTR